MPAERVTIAGVPVDLVTMKQALNLAREFLRGNTPRLIVTPNPEMAVLAAKDRTFAGILKSSDLAICDGFGLKLAGWLWKARVPEVVSGTDFALALAWLCEREGKRLYLLGGLGDVAEKSAKFLRAQFPQLQVVGAESGGTIVREWAKWEQDPYLVARLVEARPDVLFVALGHGKQETWIREHLGRVPSVRVAIGIGGAFDYWSGFAQRPPRLVRLVHLEWLWRLIMDPKGRAPRIFDAIVRFPLLALKKRLTSLQ
jgi:N-acetylglucosaminyldiphosphoundecaprenol N-acetyl-beta-D-mannosaminyltransferase